MQKRSLEEQVPSAPPSMAERGPWTTPERAHQTLPTDAERGPGMEAESVAASVTESASTPPPPPPPAALLPSYGLEVIASREGGTRPEGFVLRDTRPPWEGGPPGPPLKAPPPAVSAPSVEGSFGSGACSPASASYAGRSEDCPVKAIPQKAPPSVVQASAPCADMVDDPAISAPIVKAPPNFAPCCPPHKSPPPTLQDTGNPPVRPPPASTVQLEAKAAPAPWTGSAGSAMAEVTAPQKALPAIKPKPKAPVFHPTQGLT